MPGVSRNGDTRDAGVEETLHPLFVILFENRQRAVLAYMSQGNKRPFIAMYTPGA